MLLRFYGSNFRSLRDEFEVSFVAADLRSDGDRGTVRLRLRHDPGEMSVLRSLAIYGANASGKSAVLLAANTLGWMIREASRSLEPHDEIWGYSPFAFDDSRHQPVRLGCTICHDSTLYEYELAFASDHIVSERLLNLATPEEPLLERDSTSVRGTWLQAHQAQALLEKPRANTPVFSFLAQHGSDDFVFELWRAFCRRLEHRDQGGHSRWPRSSLRNRIAKRIHTDDRFKSWLLDRLIKPADLGIYDIRVEKVEFPRQLMRASEGMRRRYQDGGPYYDGEFLHYGAKTPLPYGFESAGTRKLYELALEWWALGHEPVTHFCDELSASLHPVLLESLVSAVNAIEGGAETGQLAFTTHDTSLMEARQDRPAALRRDQVYITEKDDRGATRVYSLVEFGDGARSVHNLRKRYLQDRYGGIPQVEDIGF